MTIRLSIFLALSVGLLLLAVSIKGELTPLERHSRVATAGSHKNGLVFEGTNIAVLTSQLQSVPDEALARVATEAVAANVVHYWPKEGDIDGEVQYGLFENWLLYAVTRTEELSHNLLGLPKKRRFSRLERWDLDRIFEKGIGFCSQVSIALVEILQQRGFDAEVTALDGHVVASTTIAGTAYTLDPDYNVVLPHSISHLEANPHIVFDAYLQAGYSARTACKLTDIYGPNGNQVGGYSPRARFIVETAEVLKYAIPILLIVGAALAHVLSVRRRRPRPDAPLLGKHA